jgi:hypothetical protein
MPIRVDEAELDAKGRPAAIALALYTLREMGAWRQHVHSYDCAMIMVAVIAITAERLLRTEMEPDLARLDRPIDPSLLQKCNIASIAHATGLNRESTRRKVNDLIQRGMLARLDDGTIFFREGLAQEPPTRDLIRRHVIDFAATANRLLKIGVLAEE